MSHERTEAIVLKAIDFSESSCIVTLFCPERGRLTCMAKGVKRPESQLAGLLDSFNRIEAIYGWKESRSVQQLFDGSLLERYAGIKSDLEKSVYGAFLLELMYRIAHENEPSHDLFDVYVDGMTQLDEWSGNVCVHVAWQLVQLLSIAGYTPALVECCGCGQEVHLDGGFSYEGGVTCGMCISDAQMDRGTLKTLRALMGGEQSPNMVGGENAFRLLRYFASRQLECDFKSARVIEQMFSA